MDLVDLVEPVSLDWLGLKHRITYTASIPSPGGTLDFITNLRDLS